MCWRQALSSKRENLLLEQVLPNHPMHACSSFVDLVVMTYHFAFVRLKHPLGFLSRLQPCYQTSLVRNTTIQILTPLGSIDLTITAFLAHCTSPSILHRRRTELLNMSLVATETQIDHDTTQESL